jgi:predicted phage terminase large subunit-like protein
MVDLRFPVDAAGNPRLTYATLHEYWDDDEYIFCCQYLCSPSSKKLVKFTEQLLMSRIVSEESLPQAGTYRTFAAWDFASSSERGSDFSFGSVGLFDSSNRGFVVDAVMDKFAKSELAFQVAKLAARWKVEKIGIEKSPGADFLETDIRIELAKAGHPHCPIEFFKVDSNKDAKESRAEGLETLLVAGRLLFSQCISIMDKIIKQFVKFKPHSKRKDDAVDGIAHLMRFMPSSFEAPLDEQARQQAVWDDLAQKELHDMIYIPRPKPEPIAEPEPPATHFEGLPIYQNTDAQIYGA